MNVIQSSRQRLSSRSFSPPPKKKRKRINPLVFSAVQHAYANYTWWTRAAVGSAAAAGAVLPFASIDFTAAATRFLPAADRWPPFTTTFGQSKTKRVSQNTRDQTDVECGVTFFSVASCTGFFFFNVHLWDDSGTSENNEK